MTPDEEQLMILRFCDCNNYGPDDFWNVKPLTNHMPDFPFPITAYHLISFENSWSWFYAAWKIAKTKIEPWSQRRDQRQEGVTRNCSQLLLSIKQSLYDADIKEAYELLVKLIQWHNLYNIT